MSEFGFPRRGEGNIFAGEVIEQLLRGYEVLEAWSGSRILLPTTEEDLNKHHERALSLQGEAKFGDKKATYTHRHRAQSRS